MTEVMERESLVLTTLGTDDIRFEKTYDHKYFCELAQVHNKHLVPDLEVEDLLNNYGMEFWKVFVKDDLKAVIGYFKIGSHYVMEGLVDKRKTIGMVDSIRVAKLMMEYIYQFTNHIRTVAKVEDRVIQRLCLRLGFKEIGLKDGLIVYEKEK